MSLTIVRNAKHRPDSMTYRHFTVDTTLEKQGIIFSASVTGGNFKKKKGILTNSLIQSLLTLNLILL